MGLYSSIDLLKPMPIQNRTTNALRRAREHQDARSKFQQTPLCRAPLSFATLKRCDSAAALTLDGKTGSHDALVAGILLRVSLKALDIRNSLTPYCNASRWWRRVFKISCPVLPVHVAISRTLYKRYWGRLGGHFSESSQDDARATTNSRRVWSNLSDSDRTRKRSRFRMGIGLTNVPPFF